MNNVLLAVLAMDAYNRGIGASLEQTGTSIGDATFVTVSDDNSISFSASLYDTTQETAAGSTSARVLSYRGTDSLVWDPIYGWPTQIGSNSVQAVAALEVYKAVAAMPGGPITLTGHSLGGGLAGYVASLHGLNATLVANMAFEDAAFYAREAAIEQSSPIGVRLRELIYGDGPINEIDRSGIHTIYVDGEVNEILRSAQATPQTALPFIAPGNIAPINLHSSALHAILAFAAETDVGFQSWSASAPLVLEAFFSDEIANNINFADFAGAGTPAGKMGSAVAYSVLSGPDDRQPWGDTAANSMLDDAKDLAVAEESLFKSAAYMAVPQYIANTVIEFAGLLARERIDQSGRPDALNGMLRTTSNRSSITVDFRDDTWTFGAVTADPSYRLALLERAADGATAESGLDAAFGWLASRGYLSSDIPGADSVKQITFQIAPGQNLDSAFQNLNPTDLSVQFLAPYDQSVAVQAGSGITITIGTSNADVVTGSEEVDALIGGSGNDYLMGGASEDFIWAGDGDDQLFGGAGWGNRLEAGDGNDLLVSEGTDDELIGGFGDDQFVLQGDANQVKVRGGYGDDIIDGTRLTESGEEYGYPYNQMYFELGDGADTMLQAYLGRTYTMSNGDTIPIKSWGISDIFLPGLSKSDVTLRYDDIQFIYSEPYSEIASHHYFFAEVSLVVDSTGDRIHFGQVFTDVLGGAPEWGLETLLPFEWRFSLPRLFFNDELVTYGGPGGLRIEIGSGSSSAAEFASFFGEDTQSADASGPNFSLLSAQSDFSWFSLA